MPSCKRKITLNNYFQKPNRTGWEKKQGVTKTGTGDRSGEACAELMPWTGVLEGLFMNCSVKETLLELAAIYDPVEETCDAA